MPKSSRPRATRLKRTGNRSSRSRPLQPGARRPTNFAHLLDYMHRTRVPAHEPPSNGPAPFRPPDCLRAAGFYFAGAAGSSGAAAFARIAALRFVSRCLSSCFAPRDPVGAAAPQTLVAFATRVRFVRTGIFHLYQPFHGASVVSFL